MKKERKEIPMKKIAALLLALVMLTGLTVTALADKTGTTKLTVVVPEADYTIHVPADTTLTYGNTSGQSIGDVYVTDVTGYNLVYVEISYTDLINTNDSSDIIPLTLNSGIKGTYIYNMVNHDGSSLPDGVYIGAEIAAVSSLDMTGYDENGYAKVEVLATVSDWSGATSGATYQAVVTFGFTGADSL
jgi:hypothetical protein